MNSAQHIDKHIVRSHHLTQNPKPAKELVYIASPDFADIEKIKSTLTHNPKKFFDNETKMYLRAFCYLKLKIWKQ